MVGGRALDTQDPEASSCQAGRPCSSVHDQFHLPTTADLLQVFWKGELWQQEDWEIENGSESLDAVVL